MFSYIGMYLALSTLGTFVLSAPLPEPQHTLLLKDMEVMRSSEFQDAAESAHSLIVKILDGIPAVHKSLIDATTLSLNKSDLSELQYLKDSLDLPEPSPLQPLSNKFQLDVSLSRLDEGLKLHKTLLKVLSELQYFKPKKPTGLLIDLRDTLLHIHKMQHLIKAVNGPEKVSESQLQNHLDKNNLDKNKFEAQVAAHLTLIQLRHFARDASRSLQSMIISPEEHETQD